MKSKFYLLNILLFILVRTASAQQIVNLYDGDAPGLLAGLIVPEKDMQTKKGDIMLLRDVTKPVLSVFIPKKKTSEASVIICPGGGYHILAWDHEGINIGQWFADRGVTAFVLKYRLPQAELFSNPEIRPLQDVQRAIRYVRMNAGKLNLDAKKVGLMGFSAGGHLAATASTHFENQVGELADKTISVRPDFSILMYPVISFSDKIGHTGSRDNLIGKDPSSEKIDYYSNELQVKPNTPPAFLVHAFDDWVHIDNSLNYYKALKKNGVASEMHLFDKGGHGFGLRKDTKGATVNWDKRLEEWMRVNGWMK
jgi:acetyl esterase/lipase